MGNSRETPGAQGNSASSTPASSGIDGLDDLLGGGFPRNRLYLIQGNNGAGKTTLGLQFALTGARAGEPVLYLTMSETVAEIEDIARSHQWSLDGVTVYYHNNGNPLSDAQQTMFHPAEVELPEVMNSLLETLDRVNPSRVVIDSLSEIRVLAQDDRWYRTQILALRKHLADRQCTVLLLDNRPQSTADFYLRSIASGVLELEQVTPAFGPARRRLNIAKIRGLSYRDGYHDVKIRTGGILVFPRLVAAEHRQRYEPQLISSGVADLDKLLGGGLDQGTSTLLMGPAGVGKSIIATLYAGAAARRGQRTVIYVFDERVQTVFKRASKMGLDLEKHTDEGLVSINQVDPGELTPGEFSYAVQDAVTRQGAKLVVIDSLSGYMNAMPEERFLTLHLHELLSYLAQQGVTSLLVLAQQGMFGMQSRPSLDISYLSDTVILLRYFELTGELRRAVSVYKRRSGAHESFIRELRIGPKGIQIGQPLKSFQGVLRGEPLYLKGDWNLNDIA